MANLDMSTQESKQEKFAMQPASNGNIVAFNFCYYLTVALIWCKFVCPCVELCV